MALAEEGGNVEIVFDGDLAMFDVQFIPQADGLVAGNFLGGGFGDRRGCFFVHKLFRFGLGGQAAEIVRINAGNEAL